MIRDFANDVEVIPVACPGLVDLVEAGILSGPKPESVIAEYLLPAIADGADTIVLGCTHFPALRQSVERVVGPSVTVIDSGTAVARQLRKVLQEQHLRSNGKWLPATDSTAYWTSGDAMLFADVASTIMGYQVMAQHDTTDVALQRMHAIVG